jgi:hypothetical protein
MPTPFVDALRGADRPAFEQLLAENVVFNSPVRSYREREEVLGLLTLLGGLLPDLAVRREVSEGAETVTFLAATVDGQPIDGVLDEQRATDGGVAEVTLMLRPLKTLLVAVERMGAALAARNS